MTAVSPGTLANFFPNRYYPTRAAYLEAMSEVMKREYEAIVQAGFILQLDCPDLALRSTWFPNLSIPEFRTVVAQNIEALNAATRDIPAEHVKHGPLRWLPIEKSLLNDLPINVTPERVRIQLAGEPRISAYFLDDNAYPPEGEWFWVKGGSRADLLLIPGSSTRQRTSSSIPRW